jgi:hypothetical protein
MHALLIQGSKPLERMQHISRIVYCVDNGQAFDAHVVLQLFAKCSMYRGVFIIGSDPECEVNCSLTWFLKCSCMIGKQRHNARFGKYAVGCICGSCELLDWGPGPQASLPGHGWVNGGKRRKGQGRCGRHGGRHAVDAATSPGPYSRAFCRYF